MNLLANFVKILMIKIKEYILMFLKTIITFVDKDKQLNEISDNLPCKMGNSFI